MVEYPYEHKEMEQPTINVEQTRKLQEQTKENILDQFISTNYYENLMIPMIWRPLTNITISSVKDSRRSMI